MVVTRRKACLADSTRCERLYHITKRLVTIGLYHGN